MPCRKKGIVHQAGEFPYGRLRVSDPHVQPGEIIHYAWVPAGFLFQALELLSRLRHSPHREPADSELVASPGEAGIECQRRLKFLRCFLIPLVLYGFVPFAHVSFGCI
jgi:hypothetical protein